MTEPELEKWHRRRHRAQICALFVDTTGTDIKTILFRVPEIEMVGHCSARAPSLRRR